MASPPAPAPGSRLFRIRRTFALDAHAAPGARIVAVAAHAQERRQLLALAVSASCSASDDPRAHFLVVRSVEEDRRVRHWRFPLAASHAKQQQQRAEPVAALAFSPEGDWLACLSTRKNRLHLVPVAKLIAGHRRTQLARAYQPPHNREWMSASPSAMTTPMASYLRATNEAGGLNGARYHSRVAGDDTQMSTLEFAGGMGAVTCVRWWRSMNGTDYCLVGGAENIISIVNVQDNAEECRCELQNAGAIESIELFYESFRKEKRTSMLVKTRARDAEATVATTGGPNDAGAATKATATSDGSTVKYYRVVLEKKTLVVAKTKPTAPPPPPPATDASTGTTGGTDDATSSSASRGDASADAVASPPPSFQRFLPPRPASAEAYVIKTFPEHFVEDMDFRPQRIKKNRPDVRLCAINGLLSSESGLAMYDGASRQVSVYGNFQWSLKGQYAVPPLRVQDDEPVDGDADRVIDMDIAYCSPDLMLLQGTSAATGTPIATWVSLPSRQGALLDDTPANAQDEAHVVHYLSLHGNERVESVLQTRSSAAPSTTGGPSRDPGVDAASGEVIYVIQTAHNVYECRPQWSRLALFRALRARTISLRDALSIGYALGIDMPSLCEVVADTLCSEHDPQRADDDAVEELQWIHDMYEVSRARPSKAVQQLTRVGGAYLAISYAKRVLNHEPDLAHTAIAFGDDKEAAQERQRVAQLAAELVFQQQAQHSFNADPSHDHNTLRPRDAATQAQLEENEAWLRDLLTAEHAEYVAEDMIELCLTHHKTDKAVAVAIARDAVAFVLQRLVARGLAPTLTLPSGTATVQALLDEGFADELVKPAHRVILRSLEVHTQLDVLLSTDSLSTILLHRDWIVRHLLTFTTTKCIQLATVVDPTTNPLPDVNTDGQLVASFAADHEAADVASSEFMAPTAAEQVELFLTLLLRINRDSKPDEGPDGVPDRFSQQALESLLRQLASQYRPPIMIARCVDYENWNAAASLHEAHGELVDAVECRLHSHQRLIHTHRRRRRHGYQASLRGRADSTGRQRHASKDSFVEEEEEEEDDLEVEGDDNDGAEADGDALGDQEGADDLAPIRTELLSMVEALVLNTPTPAQSMMLVSKVTITDTTRAAILARLMVKWFEYGLARADLEVYLIDSKVFEHVAAPLARIFFSEIIERVGGKGLHPSRSLTLPTTQKRIPAAGKGAEGFDERDKAWVRRCHTLPFSGQFLFRVCMWLLDQQKSPNGSSGKAQSVGAAPPQLLDVVMENIEKNDLAIRAVRIEPHSAQAIGKSDPLETHVKAFSCGHFFPKRIFDEDVLPEFEKRMTALPTPLFATKQLLMSEFKRSHVEAPCPVCAFNKISATVFQQRQLKNASAADGSQAQQRPPESAYYFLHRDATVPSSSTLPSPFGSSVPPPPQQLQHDEWEWRGVAAA